MKKVQCYEMKVSQIPHLLWVSLALGVLGLLFLPLIIWAAWQERQDRQNGHIIDVRRLSERIDYDLLGYRNE